MHQILAAATDINIDRDTDTLTIAVSTTPADYAVSS
jgi:hypothetical protein